MSSSNKATLIILEGCDGAGKSTVADNLRTMFGGEENRVVAIVHYGPPDTDVSVVDTYMAPLRRITSEQLDNERLVVICDRFAVGEIVYGEVLRNHDRTVPTDFEAIYAECETIFDSVKYWYVRPEFDVVRKRFLERGDDLVDEAQLAQIYSRYDSLLLTDTTEELGSDPRHWGVIPETTQNLIASIADEHRS